MKKIYWWVNINYTNNTKEDIVRSFLYNFLESAAILNTNFFDTTVKEIMKDCVEIENEKDIIYKCFRFCNNRLEGVDCSWINVHDLDDYLKNRNIC